MAWKDLDSVKCGLSSDKQNVRWDENTGDVQVLYFGNWKEAGRTKNFTKDEAYRLAAIWLSDKK
ncbi:MAG: hypothetical protein Q7T77_03825 [Sulfuricurvum sp.]|nr:hypothetical protein [Sulfuricurvum sp.]